MTDKLNVLLSCLPDSPFKEQLLSEIKQLQARLTTQYIDLDRLIGALEVLAKLGGGTSEGNMIAKQALAYGVPKESEVN